MLQLCNNWVNYNTVNGSLNDISDVYNYSVGTRHYEDSLQGALLSLMIAITVQCNNL